MKTSEKVMKTSTQPQHNPKKPRKTQSKTCLNCQRRMPYRPIWRTQCKDCDPVGRVDWHNIQPSWFLYFL